MSRLLRAALRRELRRAADPEKARAMQAYMKSSMPFYGVQADPLREIENRVFARYPMEDAKAWEETILDLWRTAEHREERYAAIALAGLKEYDAWQTMRALPLYEELITTGAWWDYVDPIAARDLGKLLRRHPAAMRSRMQEWSCAGDVWKRRAAILCQLHMKKQTDLGLLYACILANCHDQAFFIRKAIGWALREYAWTDPEEVYRFVDEHSADLSTLSRKEALRNYKRLNGSPRQATA